MENAITILHVLSARPEAVEQALTDIFVGEERPSVLRLEGTFTAVLARLTDPTLAASYRYLICRPHPAASWTPLLELGTRTEGLDIELSRSLAGAVVFTTFAYDDGLSGYRCVRAGELVDDYVSDPTYFSGAESEEPEREAIAARRGDPSRFSDLLPAGTAPEDFARIVLRPGWWDEYDASHGAPADGAPASATAAAGPPPRAGETAGGEDDEGDLVDEVDRMRCIALALELWGPAEYPFTQDLDTLENKLIGPAIAVAYT
jgi:hypothetical protein